MKQFDVTCFSANCFAALTPVGPKRGPDGKIPRSKEHELLQDLIYTENYDNKVRPVLENGDILTVNFTLKLVQIVDVVSKVHVLSLLK